MMLTIALLVFATSIAAFFAQEFGRLFKKIFAIPGVKLLVPLALASWLISAFESWGYWLLIRMKAGLHHTEDFIAAFLPFEMIRISIVRIIFLVLFANVPIWVSWYFEKRRGHYEPKFSSFCIGYMLWILASILLIVPKN